MKTTPAKAPGAFAKFLARIEGVLKNEGRFRVVRPEGSPVRLRKLTVLDVYHRYGDINKVGVVCEGLFVGHFGPHEVSLTSRELEHLGIEDVQMGMGQSAYGSGTVAKSLTFTISAKAFTGALAADIRDRFPGRFDKQPSTNAASAKSTTPADATKTRKFASVEPALAAAAHLLRAGKKCELAATKTGGAILTVGAEVPEALLPIFHGPALITGRRDSRPRLAA